MEAPWQEIKRQVMDGLDMSREFTDEELRERIALAVRGYSKEKLLSLKVRESYEEQIFNSFRRLDVLQELLDDPEVTEIMVNGEAHIFYEKEGALFRSEIHGLAWDESRTLQRTSGRYDSTDCRKCKPGSE